MIKSLTLLWKNIWLENDNKERGKDIYLSSCSKLYTNILKILKSPFPKTRLFYYFYEFLMPWISWHFCLWRVFRNIYHSIRCRSLLRQWTKEWMREVPYGNLYGAQQHMQPCALYPGIYKIKAGVLGTC